MALRTLSLSKEEYPASFRISWQRQALASASQGSEVGDHRGQFGDAKRRKRWHAAGWFSIRQNLRKFHVGFQHNRGPCGYIRSAFAAACIESVTPRANTLICQFGVSLHRRVRLVEGFVGFSCAQVIRRLFSCPGQKRTDAKRDTRQ